MKRKKYWTSIVDVIAVKKSTEMHVAESDPINYGTETISTEDDAERAARHLLKNLACEGVVSIMIDNGHRIIGAARLFIGTPNQCAVYPRNVYAAALLAGASAIILAHNHPGGSITPSEADWQFTTRIYQIGKLMEIPLLDHIIITDTGKNSMRKSNRWPS